MRTAPDHNNVILPLEGETYDPTRAYVTELSVAAIAEMTPAMIFEDLSDHFWLETFGDMTRAELMDAAKQIHLPVNAKASKPKLVATLVKYYRELTGA